MSKVEISFEIAVNASGAFRIDRGLWATMTAAQKRARIEEHCNMLAHAADDGRLVADGGAFSLTIMGRSENAFKVYDPEA